jgi:single-strand DNA-binding protein
MKSINKVTLIGAVGRDPEMRYTAAGMAIASFSLATSKKNKDKEETTQWHNIVAFQKTAELIEQYVKKGSKLYIEGELQYQEYEKDGIKKIATKIVVNDMSFLTDGGNQSSTQGRQTASGKSTSRAKAPAPVDEFEDDSIPF